MNITTHDFNSSDNSVKAFKFILTNDNGVVVTLTNFGAAITSVSVPDKDGNVSNVVLGYKTLDGYITDNSYFGFTVGRFANRIGNAQFELDGKTYNVPANDGTNCLHGGKGLHKRLWFAELVSEKDKAGVYFNIVSPDGDDGFPGALNVHVLYTLDNENNLRIEYSAETDKKTVINFTNHSYFNLLDGGKSEILNHKLQLNCDSITPISEKLIPTGKLMDVTNTPFDFREKSVIAEKITQEHEQLKIAGGFDHNFVINGESKKLNYAGKLSEPVTGRTIEVHTTEPGMQVYTGNFMDGTVNTEGEDAFNYRCGICLETQHFPDSPNQPEFPTTELNPGEKFYSVTNYKFGVSR